MDYSQALQLLKRGDIVALPTETVYGLAGRIDLKAPMEKIFHIKRRPLFNPLIVHCHSKDQARCYMKEPVPDLVEALWDRFSPGPLTLVMLKNDRVSPLITAHQETIALRIPRHPILLKILRELKIPLAAPSANQSGCVSPTRTEHVLSAFKGEVPVLDGGACEEGVESTIIKPDIPSKKLIILRPGTVTKENIQKFLKEKDLPFSVVREESAHAPGGGTSHYAPGAPLFILENFHEKDTGDFLKKQFKGKLVKQLVFDSRPELSARRLYHDLRNLSQGKNAVILVQKTRKHKGMLWDTIWNRLEKASSGKFKI